jgi:hypothetical protein
MSELVVDVLEMIVMEFHKVLWDGCAEMYVAYSSTWVLFSQTVRGALALMPCLSLFSLLVMTAPLSGQ